jgi:RNA polymerase sigma-70 factor, ECF subfamily
MEKKEIELKSVKEANDKAIVAIVETLFKSHYQQLCNYAFYFLKDREEAEDAVQSVFYSLWEKRDAIEITSFIKSYLFTAVRNNCLKKISHMKVRKEHREETLNTSEWSTENTMERVTSKELEEQIKNAVENLPEQCGNVFKLSRYGGLKYGEIASDLGISIKTVENHMGKALKILRSELKGYLLVMAIVLINNLNS